jgi:preprotein translocase subunit SecD
VRAAWLVLLAVLALAGCSAEVTGAPAKDASPSVGNVALVVPIEMRPVILRSGGTTLKDPETGEWMHVDEPILTIEQLDGAEIAADQTTGDWMLTIHLNDKDSTTFEHWTADHTGQQLAVVIDDKVIVAPTIQEAIAGGDIQITGDFTRKDVEVLLDRITGRG